jgi:hypothetical protein
MTTLTLSKARRRAKWSLAIQEAGHAVIAYRIGIKVTLATIEPGGDYFGRVEHEHAPTSEDMLVALAGPMADRHVDPIGTQHDHHLANEEASTWEGLAEYAEATGIELDDDHDERRMQLNDLYDELSNEVRKMLRDDCPAI